MTSQVETAVVKVRNVGNTYKTGKVHGLSASCTAGEKQAARAVGIKAFGASLVSVSPCSGFSDADHYTSYWELRAESVFAWCDQSGEIGFGSIVPAGALKFAKGMDTPLREIVGLQAMHNSNDERLFVPGVPEAETDSQEKVDSLIRWVEWCAKSNGDLDRQGVFFGRPLEGVL